MGWPFSSYGITLQFSDSFLYGNARPSSIKASEIPNPNVFVDFQIIEVLDRIAPNILVTEDIALEVNSTNPDLTTHPTLEGTMGCFDSMNGILCELKIRPPAIFDIADPFPTIKLNVTSMVNPIPEFKELDAGRAIWIPTWISYFQKAT